MKRTVDGVVHLLIWVISTIPAFAYETEIKDLASQIASAVSQKDCKSVAVVDFNDLQGNVTELGRFLAEELSVALAANSDQFQVVDRTHLRALLVEHKLSSSGLVDPATAKQLGEIAGVDALITGTITPFGDSVRLAVKVLDTSTARIIDGRSTEIARTNAIDELLARSISLSGTASEARTGAISSRQPERSRALPSPVTIHSLRFSLERCEREGGVVKCESLVENVGEDSISLSVFGGRNVGRVRVFGIGTGSNAEVALLNADDGAQHVASGLKMGSESDEHEVRQTMFPAVPLRLTITFPEVDNAANFSLIFPCKIHSVGRQMGEPSFTVVFRGVSLIEK